MAERDLLVRILGDDRDLQRALHNTERSVQRIDNRTATFGRNIKTAFGAAGITLGGAIVLDKVNESIQAASDLNEQISRTEVILGDSSDAMVKWSETTASSMGISQRAALAASATFAGLFQTVGVNQAEAGELSRTLVKLAADLASLSNTSPEEALIALRSGLAGEVEPLRRYNVFLSEAVVQQRAMSDTGKENAKQLTIQEKTLARYNLILEQTAPAQGNFALTSGELANQQRIARAEIDDLSASIGQVFIPAMEGAVGAAGLFAGSMNDAIKAMSRFHSFLRETDAFDGWNSSMEDAASSAGGFFDRIREGIPLLGQLRAAVVGSDFGNIGNTPEGDNIFTGGADAADRLLEGQKLQARILEEAAREGGKGQDSFSAFQKGMGLKLDKAQLTQTLNDDLAALRELESAILRRIEKEGETFKLVNALTQARLRISAIVQQQAGEAQRAGEDAFEATMDALSLDLDRAEATRRANDNITALRAIENAILAQIKAEGKTTDLLRQLFEVRRKQAQAAEDLRKQKQFTQLGLTLEGEARGPSVQNLRQRANRLEDQIRGTVLDTPKTQAMLDRIAKVLSGKFGKVGKDVRAAILDMLNQIASAFKDGSKGVTDEAGRSSGEITRGGIRSTDMLLRGLGLTPEQEEAFRKRNLGVSGRRGLSAFGFGIGAGGAGRGTGLEGFGGAAAGSAIPPIHIHLEVDGKEISDVVVKDLQKRGARSAPSRRGRHGGRNLGLG